MTPTTKDQGVTVLEPPDAPPDQRLRPLVDRMHASLRGLAYRVLGDHHHAEEVVADAFVKVMADPVITRPDDEVAAWLRRVTINGALNRARREYRSHARIERAGRLAGPVPTPDPADEVVAREDRAAVRRALAQLPERQHALLLMRATGCSYAEIATTLGVAKGSVGTLLARATRAFLDVYQPAHADHGEA